MERLGLEYCLQVTIETKRAAEPKTLHSCFMGRLGRLPVVVESNFLVLDHIGKFRKQDLVNPLLVHMRQSLSNLSSFKQIEANIQI